MHTVHGIGAKSVSNWEENIYITCFLPNWQTFIRKKDIHVNRLESVIFRCRVIFYIPEQNAKGDSTELVLEMQK